MAGPVGDGIVLVDKSPGITSHDVVSRVRRAAGTKKVGHAGTLDPMATGLLLLGVNRATRLLTYLVGADKTYLATVRLGQGTVTDDAEGDLVSSPGIAVADEGDVARLHDAVAALTGPIEQVPSSVSAIKVGGKRSYARVRAGESVELPARAVTVHSFEVLQRRAAHAVDGTEVLDLDVRVRCSSGTYIRALARDLGLALGSAGHLTALRRSHVGAFDVSDAQVLEEIAESGVVLASMTEVARTVLPARVLTEDETREVRYGRGIDATGCGGDAAADAADVGPGTVSDDVVAGFAPDGHVVALLADRGAHARPVLVLDPA